MRHFGRLGLGTVQWGTVYGLANDNGITTGSEVSSILLAARDAGLVMLDTAALYGGAEASLGVHDLANFKVVTKNPRFARRTSRCALPTPRRAGQSNCSAQSVDQDPVKLSLR